MTTLKERLTKWKETRTTVAESRRHLLLGFAHPFDHSRSKEGNFNNYQPGGIEHKESLNDS